MNGSCARVCVGERARTHTRGNMARRFCRKSASANNARDDTCLPSYNFGRSPGAVHRYVNSRRWQTAENLCQTICPRITPPPLPVCPPRSHSPGKVSVCCAESLTVNEHTSYDAEAKRKMLLSNLTLVISCALSSDLSCSLFRKILLAQACNLASVSISKRVDSIFFKHESTVKIIKMVGNM